MAPKVELRRTTTIPAFACPDDWGFSMARVTVEMPAELVEPLRETVLLLYGATAESLGLALKARAEQSGPLEEVDAHRARLAELDALLGRLAGAATGAEAPPSVRVEAPRDVLHDALYGALIDAGERLAQASERSWRGELPLDRVRTAAEEVLAIDRLLRSLPASAGGGP